jgi:hypothetical protein
MPKANRRGRIGGQDRRRVIPTAGALALAVSALGAWLVTSAAPAYADVGTSTYTIGTPTDAVGSVMASPSTVVQSGPTSFEVTFKATAALSGADAGTITIASSVSLTSAPSNVAAIDDSGTACFQTGTNGGGVSTSGLTVDLGASCNLNAGAEVEVDFTAGSPVEAGEFDFTVTTSGNATPAVSNAIIVSGTPPTLSVSSTALGANANYTITDAS